MWWNSTCTHIDCLKDMHRFPSPLIRIFFEGPDVHEETLYKLLRVRPILLPNETYLNCNTSHTAESTTCMIPHLYLLAPNAQRWWNSRASEEPLLLRTSYTASKLLQVQGRQDYDLCTKALCRCMSSATGYQVIPGSFCPSSYFCLGP